MAPSSRGPAADSSEPESLNIQPIIEHLPFVDPNIPPPPPSRSNNHLQESSLTNSSSPPPNVSPINGGRSIFHRKSASVAHVPSPGSPAVESVEKKISNTFQRFAGKIRETREGQRGHLNKTLSNEDLKSLNHSSSPSRSAQSPIKQRITYVEAWDTNVYIGTSDGYVFHYTSNGQSSSDQSQWRLITRKPLVFGQKVIEKMIAMPSLLMMVILCDSTLSFYTLPNLTPITNPSFPFIKGVTCLSEDLALPEVCDVDGSVSLAVVKRRSVQLLRLRESVKIERDFPISDSTIVAQRYGIHLCVADLRQYSIVNLRTGQVSPLIQTSQSYSPNMNASSSPKHPTIASLGNGEFLLSSSTGPHASIGVFVSASTGDAVRGTLEWPAAPRSITAIQWPLVVSLLHDNTIQVHDVTSQKLVQTIPIMDEWRSRQIFGVKFGGIRVRETGSLDRLRKVPLSKAPAPTQAPKSTLTLALSGASANKQVKGLGTSTKMILAGNDNVRVFVGTPFLLKVDRLLYENRVEEALDMTEATIRSLSPIEREGMKEELCYIYQRSSIIYLAETLFDDAAGLLIRAESDPRILLYLFPQFWPRDTEATRACLAQAMVYADVLQSLNEVGSMEQILSDKDMRTMLETNATEMLKEYLQNWRSASRMNGNGNTDRLGWLVDMVLFNLYQRQESNRDMINLLRGRNSCTVEECEATLKEGQQFYALSLLYKNSNETSRAIDLWQQLLNGELRDAWYSRTQLGQMLIETLNNQGAPDVLSILKILPDHWPLQNLEDFWTRTLRAGDSQLRESQVLKALARGANLRMQSDWVEAMEGQKSHIERKRADASEAANANEM